MVTGLALLALALRSGLRLRRSRTGSERRSPDDRHRHLRLQNILLQLKRYFRWDGAANLSAQVVFFIKRDGSVGGVDVLSKSGNFRFDVQAIEAVEQAGRAKAFGPLPDDWQGEKLYILNTFEPQR